MFSGIKLNFVTKIFQFSNLNLNKVYKILNKLTQCHLYSIHEKKFFLKNLFLNLKSILFFIKSVIFGGIYQIDYVPILTKNCSFF
jgi:hypothetical protein